jgi:hypothetical protein
MSNPHPLPENQFKKGNTASVGNKGGRPRGKSMKKILKHMLQGKVTVDENVVINKKGDVVKELTTKEALALKLIKIALQGEDGEAMRAILAIVDRVDGKLTDKVEQKNINPYTDTEADEKMYNDHVERKARGMAEIMVKEELAKINNKSEEDKVPPPPPKTGNIVKKGI